MPLYPSQIKSVKSNHHSDIKRETLKGLNLTLITMLTQGMLTSSTGPFSVII
jgi:hypothetical protein